MIYFLGINDLVLGKKKKNYYLLEIIFVEK